MGKSKNKHLKGKKKNNNNKEEKKLNNNSNNKNNKIKKYKNKKIKDKTENNKIRKIGFWKRHYKFAIFVKVVLALILLVVIVGAGAIVALFKNDNWTMNKEELTFNNMDTIIYDKDGKETANVSGDEKRRPVPLNEIPKQLQDAYISIEDERFYEHKGIDVKRTLGATVNYIIHKGNSSYGGSTITQQLIKNLKNDKSDSGIAGIQRKIREMSRAYKVEKILSKNQILELYLNLIFVGGQNICGVELGSRYYFNKSVRDLDLAECAFLAGINHSPNSYNPYMGKDNADIIKKRSKIVLGKMKELGKINEEEFNKAKEKIDAGLQFTEGDITTSNTMTYLERAALNQVIDQFAEKNDVDRDVAERMISGGGYKIYTTQDSKIQAQMEEVYHKKDHIFKGVAKKDDGKLVNEGHTQSAMVIIDHKTGRVVGCMGGLGTDVDANGQNRATQMRRQPGSAIKPLAAIGPGLESGIITAGTVYDESRSHFGKYSPNPDDVPGKGLYTVGESLVFSANTIPVKIVAELGPTKSIEYIKKFGITSAVTAKEDPKHNDENLSFTLGGATKGISPLEMAGAYATIANDGNYITPTFYTKVEDVNGNVIMEPKQETRRVLSEANAFILKNILKGPITKKHGTATSCGISGMDTGGKTGTTSGNYDRWFCGFTPYYTAATWYGFDHQENLYKAGANYPNRACRLWKSVMAEVHKELPKASFKKPGNVVGIRICRASGKRASETCNDTYVEYFVKGTIPGECKGHVKLTICKETGKIATEYCKDVEEKIYPKKPEKEDTTLWRTEEGNKYKVPTETCDKHVKKEIKIPNLIGKAKDDVLKILNDLKLKVTVETKESDKKPGIVLSISKKINDKLFEGDPITIVVSKEKKEEKPKPEDKPEEKPETKPNVKPENKPGKPEIKPEDKEDDDDKKSENKESKD